MQTIIWWIRRDLRLNDNPTLLYALSRAEVVIPVFILDPQLLSEPPDERQQFLFCALKSLDNALRDRGSRLIVREGAITDALRQLIDETGAELIAAEADISPYSKKRDKQITQCLPITLIHGLTVHPSEAVLKPDGNPYTIFTPFSKKWKSLPAPGKPYLAPARLPSFPTDLFTSPIPNGKKNTHFPADENAARERMIDFLGTRVSSYEVDRNLMAIPGTSMLSPYLKFGLLSAREVVYRIHEKIDQTLNTLEKMNASVWLNELIWREFYFSILDQFPHVSTQSFRENLRSIKWRESKKDLYAWQNGNTGYPIVDAGMRQLLQTGWMHNRARMITASFLVKDLLINWQEGESWFMQHLIDGESASNNGGWQWTAGTGTDAAPYFRIFNPIIQSKKFDPKGDYIRKWVPELRDAAAPFIHEPWKNPQKILSYPAPMIDHAQARQRTLEAYQNAKDTFIAINQ